MKQMTEAPCPSPHRCPESGTVGPTNYDVECFFAKYPNYIYIFNYIYNYPANSLECDWKFDTPSRHVRDKTPNPLQVSMPTLTPGIDSDFH